MRILVAIAILFFLLVVNTSKAQAAGPIVGPTNPLAWNAVTVNADNTPITDLAGYEVLICSTTPCTALSVGVSVRNVGLTSTPATPSVTLGTLNISQGQRYVVVRSVDTAGKRSDDVNKTGVVGPAGEIPGVSNEVPFVFDVSRPGTPGGLRLP